MPGAAVRSRSCRAYYRRELFDQAEAEALGKPARVVKVYQAVLSTHLKPVNRLAIVEPCSRSDTTNKARAM